ncbi:immunomodulatory protein FIP-Fve [Earliella scabrosa]|nr:immunomodulatory protein FIP-Fve [Earliella scabrosa]
MCDLTLAYFQIISQDKKFCVDYTPNWTRGNPSRFIDNVVFPRVLTNKRYDYRIVKNETDLGVRQAYSVSGDGSQKVNFLEYNAGRGIEDTSRIRVYAVDPDNGNQFLVAQWN